MKRLCKRDESPKAILDIKGMVIQMLARGIDPDAMLDEDGKKVNTAGFGFRNFLNDYLKNILEDHSPRQIIAVWDGGRAYRTMLYKQYKGKKKPFTAMRETELNKMYDGIKSFLAYLGCTQLCLEGQEADDVIAFLCQRIPHLTSVYTIDQDLLQLADDTTLVHLRGDATEEFKDMPAKYTTIFKSLVGDSSDNIPGVKGFGEKGFQHLIDTFGFDGIEELENCIKTGDFSMLENGIEETDDKQLKKIFAGRYADVEKGLVGWQMSYKLVTLAPWLCEKRSGGNLPNMQWYKRVPNRDRCFVAMQAMNSAFMFEEYEKYFGQVTLITKENEGIVLQLLEDKVFARCHIVSFDVESKDKLKHETFQRAKRTGNYLDVLSQELTGASFCFGDNYQDCIYVSVGHADTENCNPELILEVLKQCDGLVVHNASFEIQVVRQSFDDYIIESPADSSVMACLVNEDDETGLKFCSKKYLGYQQITYQEVMESAREELIAKLLTENPEAGKIQELVTKAEQAQLMYQDTMPDLDKEGKATAKVKIAQLKEAVRKHRTLPAFRKVEGQLSELQSADIDMGMLTGEQAVAYGCDDSICTAHIWQLFDLILTLEETADFNYKHAFDPVHILNQSFEQGENIDYPLLAQLQTEDKEVVADRVALIRHLLTVNCAGTSEARANSLFESDQQHYYAKWKSKGEVTSDYLTAMWKSEVKDLLVKTSYTPVMTYKDPIEFKPTAKQLDTVRELVGIETKIEKVSKSNLADWATGSKFVSLMAKSFRDKLLAALDELKPRAGEHYERLDQFCCHVLLEAAPEKTKGDELNLGSPNQISDLLYLKLGLPVRHRTRPQYGSFRSSNRLPGSPSTNEKAIRLAIANDTVEGDWRRSLLIALIDAKAALTRESFYYTPYPLWEHPRDGRVHGSIRFPSTATRRPTASSPNFLQVTKKDGGKVRNTFRPLKDEDRCVAIDFAGQELRIAASESKDPVLLDAYIGENQKDIHSVTGAMICYLYMLQNNPELIKSLGLSAGSIVYEVFRKYFESDDKEVHSAFKAVRTIAKTVNFLIIYGGGYSALAMQLSMSNEISKQFMSKVMQSYARLDPWKNEVLEFARTYGFVVTAYGNRRHVGSAILAKDEGVRGGVERTTVNFVIQGCAADILAEVMSNARKERIFAETQADILKPNGVIPIYDEIKAYSPVASIWDYVNNMQRIMNVTPPGHAVPMVAEVSIGPRWGSLKELGANPTKDEVMEACEIPYTNTLISIPAEAA